MFIYAIVCSESLKLYVGQHRGEDLGKYLSKKFYVANHNTSGARSHLYAAMRKHPRDSWSIHPLVSGIESKAELDETERFLIYALKAQHPDVGYNICDGGEGFTGEHTIAARQKMSQRLVQAWTAGKFQDHGANLKKRWASGEFQGIRGKHQTSKWMQQHSARLKTFRQPDDAKEKIRQALMGHEVSDAVRSHARELGEQQVGEKNPFFGRHHSDESKAANAAAHLGRTASEATKRKMSQAQKARQELMRRGGELQL